MGNTKSISTKGTNTFLTEKQSAKFEKGCYDKTRMLCRHQRDF